MNKFLRNIIPFAARIIPTPAFSEVTFYRHKEERYLYYCMSEDHIKDDDESTAQQKFFELFPKAIRISETEFNLIHFFRPDIEVVEVADEKILAIVEEELQEINFPRIMNPGEERIPKGGFDHKEHDGNYADDEHEESEDKNINDN